MNIKVFVTCMVFDEAENIKDVGLVVDDSKGQFSCRGWWWVITEKIRIRFDTSDNVDNGIMELEGNQSDHLKMNFSYTMQEMPQRRLKSLPLHGQGMPSLQQLIIDECPRLKSLSESKSQGMIPYLPSLQELTINDCSEELSTGWGKESEEVWPNIKHIPNIIIDYYYIQKEGRYVEGEGLEWKRKTHLARKWPLTVCLQQPSSKHESIRSLEDEFLIYIARDAAEKVILQKFRECNTHFTCYIILLLLHVSIKQTDMQLNFQQTELRYRVKDDNIIHTLKLSYDPLPSYMKHCFAYCSLLPKGVEIDVKSLFQLWIAQGFISSSSSGECLETVALRCFKSLLWRSFFHEVKRDGFGDIRSCKMHDFMHDLATKVAGS
uniref:Disease resistance protein winged helix domain-containing protein n=1 Tax=Salix viminalis TaxID=40686 RepID=A0A6N2NBB6_SALVM